MKKIIKKIKTDVVNLMVLTNTARAKKQGASQYSFNHSLLATDFSKMIELINNEKRHASYYFCVGCIYNSDYGHDTFSCCACRVSIEFFKVKSELAAAFKNIFK